MEIVLGWIVFSIVAGVIANARGRSGFGFFLLSLVLSPLIGILLAACLPSRVYVDADGVVRRVRGVAPEPDREEPSEAYKWVEFLAALIIVAMIVLVAVVYMVGGTYISH